MRDACLSCSKFQYVQHLARGAQLRMLQGSTSISKLCTRDKFLQARQQL